MTQYWNQHYFKLVLSGILAKLALLTELVLVAGNGDRVLAQIIPDRSLGTEASVVTPNVEIKGQTADRIDGGAIRDSNLFHSFQEFNIGDLQRVYFANPAGITNIFSRVTGSNLSEIFGTLGVNGNANLFLLNPNGIIFGENASLDVGGSFVGSTADSLVFENGFEFNATDSQTPPLLTINIPIGLGFRDNPEEIVNRSSVQNNAGEFVGLEVAPGKNLTLVGGNINFEAGAATARGGVIELGGLSTAGIVDINEDGSLSFPEDVAKVDINLSNAADVDVRGAGGGSITINARNLNLEAGEQGSSFLRAGITSDSTSAEAQAGNIIIDVAENITLNDSRIINQVDSGAVGNAGDITITTDKLNLTNGGLVDASTYGGRVVASTEERVNAGSVEITASDTIMIDGEDSDGTASRASSLVFPGARGDGGDVTITTGSLSLTNGGVVAADTFGQGNAGSVEITASDTITIDGENSQGFGSGAFSGVGSGAVGDTGGVTINTNSLTLTNGGEVSAIIFGQGNAGQVTINASDTISIDGEDPGDDETVGGIFSSVNDGGIGNAGGVTITTGSLSLTNGGTVGASIFGQGNAGQVTINASDTISVDGEDLEGFSSGAFSGVGSEAEGDAGDVTINTGSLSLTNGGEVSASTFGQGNAGTVKINASDTISAEGESSDGYSSGIFSTVEESGVGNAGGININTNNLSLTDDAEISVGSLGQGNAGDLSIQANSIALDNGASLLASTPVGTGGNITLQIADNLILRNNSTISAQATGNANGGNVTIDADLIVAFPQENSDITANAMRGNGGNINIDAQNILGFELQEDPNLSDITASSEFGFDGTVNINTLGIEPGQESIELPIEIVDVSKLIDRNLCLAGQEGEFIITGKGGLSPSPKDPLNTDAGWEDWRMVVNSESNHQQSSQTQSTEDSVKRSRPEANNHDSHQIVEAQSWFIAPNGNVVLSAQPVKSVSRSSSFLPPNCQLLDEVKQ